MCACAGEVLRVAAHTLLWGIRGLFCLLLPAAIVPTEWFLLDLGNVAYNSMSGSMWLLAVYALLAIGFVGGLGALVGQVLRALWTRRVAPLRGVVWSLLALVPAALLVACKFLDVDERGFLSRHEATLRDFAEHPRDNALGYRVFWQDEDLVVVEVHCVWQLRQVTGFAYCRSAADAVARADGATGTAAAESAAALERLAAAWPNHSCTGSHLRGPWSTVTVL
ncbi:MAG: hypothetical protein FJ298_11160 [Planctomycetes bacterium]|nr:hypothetical protein [Planctomycetota bacterium]